MLAILAFMAAFVLSGQAVHPAMQLVVAWPRNVRRVEGIGILADRARGAGCSMKVQTAMILRCSGVIRLAAS